jgi:hypothetical protein
MDNDFARIVRKHFLKELTEKVNQFEPHGGKGRIQTPGWRSFLWSVADDLHFFIGLGVDAAAHTFTVEGAWSASPEYPAVASPRVLPDLGKDPLDKPQLVFRLGASNTGGTLMERDWRESDPASEEAIQTHVEEAVRMIQRDFLPIFLARGARKGIELSL